MGRPKIKPAPKLVANPRDPGRRSRILVVAKRHFAQRGFKATNLDAIALEAGCAKGALYLEFHDKRALLQEVVRETYNAVIARYDAEVLSVESPFERVIAALEFSYRESAREPLFGKLIQEHHDLLSLIPKDLIARARTEVPTYVRWIDDAKKRGEIRDDVDSAAILNVIGVLKLAPYQLASYEDLRMVPPERTLDAVIDILRAGLAGKNGRRRKKRSP
jgi:TetR/AcrR family fatty acid metabolism transcriptional regulator